MQADAEEDEAGAAEGLWRTLGNVMNTVGSATVGVVGQTVGVVGQTVGVVGNTVGNVLVSIPVVGDVLKTREEDLPDDFLPGNAPSARDLQAEQEALRRQLDMLAQQSSALAQREHSLLGQAEEIHKEAAELKKWALTREGQLETQTAQTSHAEAALREQVAQAEVSASAQKRILAEQIEQAKRQEVRLREKQEAAAEHRASIAAAEVAVAAERAAAEVERARASADSERAREDAATAATQLRDASARADAAQSHELAAQEKEHAAATKEAALTKREAELMRQVEEMRIQLAVESMGEAARARDRDLELSRQHDETQRKAAELHASEQASIARAEMLAKQEAGLREQEAVLAERQRKLSEQLQAVERGGEAARQAKADTEAAARAAAQHETAVRLHAADLAAQSAKESLLAAEKEAALARQEALLKEQEAQVARQAAEAKEACERREIELKAKQMEIEEEGNHRAAERLELLQRDAALRADADAIKRMRAELHLQEALVVQREEDAKCHEEALRLRRVKLIEMRLGMRLKQRVMKAHALEQGNAEDEHEQEVDTYRAEVEDIRHQLKEQEAVCRRQAVALQQQKQHSFKRLDAARSPSGAPPTRPWHHMKPPEAGGKLSATDRTTSLPVGRKSDAFGSVKDLLTSMGSFGGSRKIVSGEL